MSPTEHPLARLVQKLSTRVSLEEADRAAILALPYARRRHEPQAYLVREGEPTRKYCMFVEAGFAFRQKLNSNGGRQIVSINMAGDFLDFQHLFLNLADHNVQALTRLDVLEVSRAALQEIATTRPRVGRAMWIDALIDASIFREWIMNVGRRDARSRVAHLLCEFALRLEASGIAHGQGYELPMTQEQIGDAVGLTSVHVNRTLKSLTLDGLIHRDRRYVGFESWEKLSAVGDFSALYLHLDQAVGGDDQNGE